MDYGKKLLDADPREAKLPAWARSMIDSLRREYEAERRRADEARLATDPAGSSAILAPHDERSPVGLGHDAMVRFKLNGEVARLAPSGAQLPYVDCYREKSGGLYVRGSDTLALRPRADNVVHVWVQR